MQFCYFEMFLYHIANILHDTIQVLPPPWSFPKKTNFRFLIQSALIANTVANFGYFKEKEQ